jgi:23S rRNA (uracil1939-C5)-methyltransferase
LNGQSIVETLIVTIQDLARGGAGVARLDSGEVVFVPFTAPGDRVSIRILERKKNYCQGELIEILTPSPIRVEAPCPHFTKCGGCSWQHLPYSLQFETKKKGLIHALNRAQVSTEGVPFDDHPAESPFHYRNRIQLHGDADRKELGFFRPGSRSIIDLDSCTISEKPINEALPSLKAKGLQEFRGEFKLEIDLSLKGEVRAAWNQRNAALGFRQVNDAQNAKLRTWVASQVRDADVLFDLFGGDGNLSLGIASRFGSIECVDLGVPKERPSGLPDHFQFTRKDMERWSALPISKEHQGKTASVILDPPREGLNRAASPLIRKISKFKIQSLVLVGCDVDAFIRDLRNLEKEGFKLSRLGALDLFPQTPHIESLALLLR